jgi:hypothetical protein
MDTSSFDSEIAAFEANLSDMKPQMEALVRQFVAQVHQSVVPWVETTVKEGVRSSPERAKAIGQDGINTVKKDISLFQQDAQEIIDDLLFKDSLWTHRKPSIEFPTQEYISYSALGNRLPDGFGRIVDKVRVYANRILEKNGFPKSNRGYECSSEMIDSMRSYSTAATAYGTQLSKLQAVQKRKAEAEVDDLWESP